jgi:hypothetical protein
MTLTYDYDELLQENKDLKDLIKKLSITRGDLNPCYFCGEISYGVNHWHRPDCPWVKAQDIHITHWEFLQ